jgi:predicted aminopeptidase
MGVIKTSRTMTSLYVNEICGNVEDTPARRRMPGDILADTGYAVVSGVSAEEGQKYRLTRLDSPENTRAVELTTPDNKVYRFIANFGNTSVSWSDAVIAPGECRLI